MFREMIMPQENRLLNFPTKLLLHPLPLNRDQLREEPFLLLQEQTFPPV
jgi:hypothetical protein